MGEGGSMVVTVPGGSGRRGARKMMETEDALVGWLLGKNCATALSMEVRIEDLV